MKINLSAHRDAFVDKEGKEFKTMDKSIQCPLRPWTMTDTEDSLCYVIKEGYFRRRYIKECRVTSIVFTNEFFINVENAGWFTMDDIGKTLFLHDDMNTAIKLCEEQNRYRKVKIKYL